MNTDPTVTLQCGCTAEFLIFQDHADVPFLYAIHWETCNGAHLDPAHRTDDTIRPLVAEAYRLIAGEIDSPSPPETNWPALVDLVETMLSAQTEYFRTRSGVALDRSKKLERETRKWLADYRAQGNQPKLRF